MVKYSQNWEFTGGSKGISKKAKKTVYAGLTENK